MMFKTFFCAFAFWDEIVVKYRPYIGVLPGKGPGC